MNVIVDLYPKTVILHNCILSYFIVERILHMELSNVLHSFLPRFSCANSQKTIVCLEVGGNSLCLEVGENF